MTRFPVFSMFRVVMISFWGAACALATPAAAITECAEAEIGICFEQYSRIPTVTATSDGYAAVGMRNDGGLDLLRLSVEGELLSVSDLGRPYQMKPPEDVFEDRMKLVASPNDVLLLVATARVGSGENRKQRGVAARIDDRNQPNWTQLLQYTNETHLILYSAAYNVQGKNFMVVGRHTDGGDPRGNCENWSVGVVFYINEADLMISGSGLTIGNQAPGPYNRIALYDVRPAATAGQFVASGFATAPREDGGGCQDNAVAYQILDNSGTPVLVAGPYTVGTPRDYELAFAITPVGADRYAMVGYGVEPRNDARAAMVAKFAFGTRPDAVRMHPFPEDGSDDTGRDRYYVAEPLSGGDQILVAGYGSESRADLNQGIWRILSADLDDVEGPYLLTEEDGSEILAAAVGIDGKVLAAGKVGSEKNDDVMGWLGLIVDPKFSVERRKPDEGLYAITQREIEKGYVSFSERETSSGTGVYHSGLDGGEGIELRISISENTVLGVSALAASGDLDLLLLGENGEIIAYSANLGSAGEYLQAKVKPGDYRVTVMAISDVTDYEIRMKSSGDLPNEEVLASLNSLDEFGRTKLSRLLENSGYRRPGNADIAFGSGTVQSVLAFYNTFRPVFEPGDISQFIANASLGSDEPED